MEKRLATFKFLNGTELRTLVDFYGPKGEQRSFDDMLRQAKEAWIGNEESGRGRLMGFEVSVIVKV